MYVYIKYFEKEYELSIEVGVVDIIIAYSVILLENYACVLMTKTCVAQLSVFVLLY
jgi:hypothetical protein